jgi:L-fuconolactonase
MRRRRDPKDEPMLKIDAHQHFWNPARGDYGWMPPDHPVLTRIYGPADLAPLLEGQGIAKTVLVQAAPSIEETEYLLGIADASPSVLAVVGWINFENRDDLQHLQRLAKHNKFAGVRPMIQDLPDDNWMLRDDVQWAFAALADLGLTFDALGFPRHLPNFLTIFRRYPSLRTVVDHCMKPQIGNAGAKDEGYDAWAEGMARIAAETSAFCKLSGIVTETRGGWSVEKLQPYASHVLSVFGEDRVMWGSDWPVCLLEADYAQWHEAAMSLCSGLGEDSKAKIFGGNAMVFYGR